MSLSLKLTSHYSAPLLHPHHHQGFRKLSISRFSRHFYLQNSSLVHDHRRQICSVNGESNGYPDNTIHSNREGSKEKSDSHWTTSSQILKKLKRYGISGLLSYGLLNTAYYLTSFLLVWFYVAPAPGKMGYLAAVERFLKVVAMVWAGSQVTKLIRAGGALALAPVVDRGLSWFTIKFKFESQGKAFAAIVGFCLGLAFILFLVVTLLWA